MKNLTFFKLSFLLEILITIFVPAQIISNPAIITYQYGLPFGYLDIYAKKNMDYHLINILFKGNEGIHVDIFALIIDLMLIYLSLCFIDYIIHKIRFRDTK